MKVVQINTFPYKATGHIMMNIHSLLQEHGYDSYVCWGRGRPSDNDHEIVIEDNFGIKFHGVYTRLLDKTGFASWRATKKLISKLDEIQPDIIHLHNVHGYYLNIEMLFNYIREHGIKVVWTLHDCWALTGHCAWFDVCGCEKWKTGCFACEQQNTYPVSMLADNSKRNWIKKKELYSGLKMTIVTPSVWLANLVKQSILREYPVELIHNGIDLEKFKEQDDAEIKKVKEKYGLDERKIVLGVASEWTPRKGLNDFIALSSMMDESIQFVLVGLTDAQLKNLPSRIKGVKRTENQQELAALYSVAALFFNPTYEDNYPTTNLEALACGTPVLTYDTGGSPEMIEELQRECGVFAGKVIVKENACNVDLKKVEKLIYEILNKKDKCHAVYRDKLDARNCFEEYLSLYEHV